MNNWCAGNEHSFLFEFWTKEPEFSTENECKEHKEKRVTKDKRKYLHVAIKSASCNLACDFSFSLYTSK